MLLSAIMSITSSNGGMSVMQKDKKKFYQAKWFLWLWLIIFPPVGLILLWTCHKEMKNKTRIILSVVFVLWFIILITSTNGTKDGIEDGLNEANQSNPQVTQGSDSSSEAQSPKDLPTAIDGSCRAMTKKFVEKVVEEDYSMLAYSVEEFDLDENENETIKILYLPSNAGDGATKVNLTINKDDSTYKIEYALLSGLYEVELDELSKEYTEFTAN